METELEKAQKRLEEKRASLGLSLPEQIIGESRSFLTTDQSAQFAKAYQLTKKDKSDIADRVCEEHGYVNPDYGYIETLDRFFVASCPVCDENRQKAYRDKESEIEAHRKAELISRNMAKLNIGVRFQGMEFCDYTPTCQDADKVKSVCQRYTETFTERLMDGDGLIFIGACGTGKNMLAAIICQEVVKQGKSTVHTTIFKLIRAIKDSWRRDSEKTEEAVINSFSQPDLLVIDEVGVQFGSDTEKLYLTEIINNRYESRKPTILISNLNLSELENVLGTRIIDRFYEGKSAILKFTWESYRRGGHQTERRPIKDNRELLETMKNEEHISKNTGLVY